MIVFNNIRISQDDKYITIDAEIENNKYYENMYIDSVIIDNQDTFSPNGPSNKPVYTYKAQPLNSDIYTEDDLANKVTDDDNIPIYRISINQYFNCYVIIISTRSIRSRNSSCNYIYEEYILL